jgi:uncharacterized protein
MRKRRVVIIVAIVIVLMILGYLGAAALVYEQVSRIQPHCDGRFAGNTPAAWTAEEASRDWTVPDFDPTPWLVPTWSEVRMPSRDPGIELRAWWMPAEDPAGAPLVVVIHGRGACILDPTVLLPAGMLWHAGYSILAVDLRDHGESTVEDGRYAGGTEEYRDVQGAIDWAVGQGYGGGGIGTMGTSMGAITALITAGQDPRVKGVWEDSGYADAVTRIAEELDQRGYPTILAAAGPLMGRLIAGDDFDAHTPLAAVGELGDRPLAIVHGGSDQATYVHHAADIAAEAWRLGVPTEVWVVPGMGHGQLMYAEPAAYATRLVAFFQGVFNGA